LIYLSTGGFSSLPGCTVANYLSERNITNIELSGGMAKDNQEKEILDLTSNCSFQVHNYYPPPKNPFVLNLASFNEDIGRLSFEHIIRAIDLSEKLGCKFYSFHAGFLIDPDVNDLGKQFSKTRLNDRDSAKKIFSDKVNQISRYAKKKGIMILLENNVLSFANLDRFGTNPFLMTDHLETIELMNSTDGNVGLLVDVAHLKVSSNIEGFCKYEYLESTRDFTFAYHLSDNDGKSDTNEAVTTNSWFWPFVRKDLNYYSLEVYGQNLEVLTQQIELTESFLSA
tara:strand:+ start:5238 stop:6086 length:849 start_codon:yes stop_codon:yes gene_type:complete